MKKTLLALFASAAFLALPAQADTDFGVKVGQLMVEDDDKAATQVGVVASWDLFGMFGIEGELNTTVADGESPDGLGGTAEYSAMQIGAYGVLMTPGPMYFKAKAGLVRTDADISTDLGDFSESGTEAAYGIGFGFTFFELEWTRTKLEDANVDLLSLSFKF
jgi:hypothetical protein